MPKPSVSTIAGSPRPKSPDHSESGLAASLPRALEEFISPEACAAAFRAHAPHARGLPAKPTAWQLVLSMIAQALAGSGDLALHIWHEFS